MSDTERSDFLSRIERFFVSRLSVLCLSALGDKSYRLVKKNARQSFHPLSFLFFMESRDCKLFGASSYLASARS